MSDQLNVDVLLHSCPSHVYIVTLSEQLPQVCWQLAVSMYASKSSTIIFYSLVFLKTIYPKENSMAYIAFGYWYPQCDAAHIPRQIAVTSNHLKLWLIWLI